MSTQGEPTPEATSETTSNIKIQMIEGQISYTTRLKQIRTLLTQENPPSADEVQSLLGHGVLAGLFHCQSILLSCYYSSKGFIYSYSGEAVPCAIFAFLKCSKDSFRELIPYSVSLGGDTDTIASMAGAIGGAYWGLENIPQEWRECCEQSSKALSLADALYDLVMPLK